MAFSPHLLQLEDSDIELQIIEPGSFLMGSPDAEQTGHVDQQPVHAVTIDRSYFIGRFPVTQVQWSAVMGKAEFAFLGAPLRPAENLSWSAANTFCRIASERSGRTVRLPSEAEWEFACRAGSTTAFHFGETQAQLDAFAWFDMNSMDSTYEVGQKRPNAWGLHDMIGNVWEWCADVWHSDYVGAPNDGAPWMDNQENQPRRVLRGGAWDMDAFRCRSAYRSRDGMDLATSRFGCRIVVEVDT